MPCPGNSSKAYIPFLFIFFSLASLSLALLLSFHSGFYFIYVRMTDRLRHAAMSGSVLWAGRDFNVFWIRVPFTHPLEPSICWSSRLMIALSLSRLIDVVSHVLLRRSVVEYVAPGHLDLEGRRSGPLSFSGWREL